MIYSYSWNITKVYEHFLLHWCWTELNWTYAFSITGALIILCRNTQKPAIWAFYMSICVLCALIIFYATHYKTLCIVYAVIKEISCKQWHSFWGNDLFQSNTYKLSNGVSCQRGVCDFVLHYRSFSMIPANTERAGGGVKHTEVPGAGTWHWNGHCSLLEYFTH